MVTTYDYIVIAFYLIFVLGIGWVFRKFSKGTSDFFRGGGSMLWWLCGATAFMTTFTAWTFTGAAGKAYETGTLVLALYLGNAAGMVFAYFFTAHRYRQMRVITNVEGVRNRYGRVTEQFYTWTTIPLQILANGVVLNAIAVFISAVFGFNLELTIIVLGTAIFLKCVLGGAWATTASDFIQMFVVMTITIVVCFLTLRIPEIGGITGLLEKAPSYHFNWFEGARPQIVLLWFAAAFINMFLAYNNITGSYRYLMVKDGKNAKKATLLGLAGALTLPLVWLIPAIAATILFPDIAERFPNLRNASDGAYIAVCMKVLPTGLIGLLVCGIFAATMSTMDTQLISTAGVFVKNFYQPFLRPKASETHLLWVGKLVSSALGISSIALALVFSRLPNIRLFDLMLWFSGIMSFPLVMPMVYGLFFKSPKWAAWSTIIVGTLTGLLIFYKVPNTWFQGFMGWEEQLTTTEINYSNFFTMIFGIGAVCTVWYFFTCLFTKYSSKAFHAKLDIFFKTVNTPIDPAKEDVVNTDKQQYHVLGLLSLVYGTFVLLLVLIPNTLTGRLCFLFCGGTVFIVGAILYRLSKRLTKT